MGARDPEWPKHPDGRPKKFGELTREQQREQMKAACERAKRHFEKPSVQAGIARALAEAEERIP